jgi:hypothetical protein
MPFGRRPLFLVAALVGAGCSAPVVDDVADASNAQTEGIVLVERVVSGDGAPRSYVSAKFMRLSVAADPELAERVVGSRLELPRLGACMRLPSGGTREQTASLAQLGPIELVDAGDLTLRARPFTMGPQAAPNPGPAEPALVALALRAFPDVGDLVSGVFYTSPDAASDLPAGVVYGLEGSGSSAIDRFAIEAEAPAAPDEVRVAGLPLADGLALEEGTTSSLRWRRGDVAKGDSVFIDLTGSTGAAVRCAFKDAGEATLPGALLRSAQLGGGDGATIAFHRIRRRPFGPGAGVDTGEIRFDLSVVGKATLLPHGTRTASASPAQSP